MVRKRLLAVAALLALTVGATLPTAALAAPQGPPPLPPIPAEESRLQLQILGVNDFHGALEPRTVSGDLAGGAGYLAAYLKQRSAEAKHTLKVHAGDMVGGSPPISALFQDEPAIEVLNAMGFDLGTVGNHEFDEGVTEMLRLIYGGSHSNTGDFAGASFPYVSANVVDAQTERTILPPYHVFQIEGMRVGFIGAVLKETPSIVIPSGTAGVRFLDEAEAINRYAAELRDDGVRALIVLIHQGGFQDPRTGAIGNPIHDIVCRLDPEIDVVISGHTHSRLNGTVCGKLTVQAFSSGTAFADVDLELDRRTKDVVSARAEIVTTWNAGVTPDPAVQAIVDDYAARVAPLVNRVVGEAEVDVTRAQNGAGESALGNLIADAQRWKMQTDFALMNPGGIRDELRAGDVTWGELYNVQPFGNDLVKMTLTGDQVYTLLSQQWQPSRTRMLQIAGLSYTWDNARVTGSLDQGTSNCDGCVLEVRLPSGAPIDRAAAYTVTVNSFMAGGGDGYTVLLEGTGDVVGPVDLDALVDYVETQLPRPFHYGIEGRITRLN